MASQPIEPGLLLRSFLTVGSAYVLIGICFFVILTSLGLLFYPQYVAFIELEPEAQQALMARNPQEAIPPSMFCIMVVLNFLCCIGVGWIVGKTAPFSHFAHGIFLAVLVFVMFLQIVIADPQAKKWMDIVYMGVLPIGVLIGAKRAAPLNQEPGGE
jgi:ABC-type transport system involved in cytochrome c biogenesis permease subunit